MTQRVMDQLREKKIFSLEFFVRLGETEEQRLMWRKWKATERQKLKDIKLAEKRNLVRPNPDTPVESTG